jgi:hypothetical protein
VPESHDYRAYTIAQFVESSCLKWNARPLYIGERPARELDQNVLFASLNVCSGEREEEAGPSESLISAEDQVQQMTESYCVCLRALFHPTRVLQLALVEPLAVVKPVIVKRCDMRVHP